MDLFQLQVAALRAVSNYILKKLTTKTLHGELLYCLSPSKNVCTTW